MLARSRLTASSGLGSVPTPPHCTSWIAGWVSCICRKLQPNHSPNDRLAALLPRPVPLHSGYYRLTTVTLILTLPRFDPAPKCCSRSLLNDHWPYWLLLHFTAISTSFDQSRLRRLGLSLVRQAESCLPQTVPWTPTKHCSHCLLSSRGPSFAYSTAVSYLACTVSATITLSPATFLAFRIRETAVLRTAPLSRRLCNPGSSI